MLIVGIDTSGRHGSVALVRFEVGARADTPETAEPAQNGLGGVTSKLSFAGERPALPSEVCGSVEILELLPLAGGAYSATLMPQLSAILSRQGVDKTGIDAFAVASGPGSFTGLRVGLSTVKALADALGKPIAAISTLEAVARKAEVDGRLLVAIDAGRGQVFVGEFLAAGRGRTPLRERLLLKQEFMNELQTVVDPVFMPDHELAEALLPSGHTIFVVEQPMADLYARIGAERILAGNTISPAELDANYIRRSDAEIFFKP